MQGFNKEWQYLNWNTTIYNNDQNDFAEQIEPTSESCHRNFFGLNILVKQKSETNERQQGWKQLQKGTKKLHVNWKPP